MNRSRSCKNVAVPPADNQPAPGGPSRPLAEITVRAFVLGALLSVILGAANVYLGLKAGMTVAASIPAAVISMGVLRLLRRGNILENNIVQTAASAGESVAAGVIFTLPALVMLGVWSGFNYWQTTVIAALGGVIGVLFTIPLRRALIVGSSLTFPEGTATAEVLRAGDRGGGIGQLVGGALAGALFKLGEAGLGLFGGIAQGATRMGSTIGYFGVNLAPALVGVGFIVGLNIAILVFLGGMANWLVAIPIITASDDIPEGVSALDHAWQVWSTQTRYLGVGAMLIGGVWALVRMSGSLVRGIRQSLAAYRKLRREGAHATERTERDTPITWVGIGLIICAIPMLFLYGWITNNWPIAIFMTVVMIVAGFLFSAVAAYMGGLVGSSNNPVSGVTIATLLTAALLLLALGVNEQTGPMAAIMIGAVVCCAAAIGGDNMQDLKAGYIVGATPWKQQVMQIVGVLAGAVVMAPVLTLLLKAYGMGPITVEGQQALTAPQATLMASVAQGVFIGGLPWKMVGIGMGIAVLVILLDLWLEKRGTKFRTPVLAVAVGLYLPLELGAAMMVGGLAAWVTHRFGMKHEEADEAEGELQSSLTEARQSAARRGLLLAAGLISGEALMGIFLAIPIVLNKGNNPLNLGLSSQPAWPGVILLAAVTVWLVKAGWVKRREP